MPSSVRPAVRVFTVDISHGFHAPAGLDLLVTVRLTLARSSPSSPSTTSTVGLSLNGSVASRTVNEGRRKALLSLRATLSRRQNAPSTTLQNPALTPKRTAECLASPTDRNAKMPIESANRNPSLRLRLGMVGGGPGAFIGAVHRIAARLDDRYELVAAALSSNPERSIAGAKELHIARPYVTYEEMATAESKRPDGIDVVSIVTPNHLHHAPAKAFLEAGIHVICDKPLTTTLEGALDLENTVKRTGLVFGLTHNYTGHPLVRQARDMVVAGELGPIRIVQVEYPQDWLSTPLEATGHKQAEWRTDPSRSGPGGSVGDIGTHAFNLACFVTQLTCEQVAADVTTFVPGRRVDDNVQVMLRFSNGVKGGLWASQVAPGNENNLRLRVYGEEAGIEWHQEDPNSLSFTPLGEG